MKSITGNAYRVNGVTFKVVAAEAYQKEKVSDRYREILKFRKGVVVAVAFRGTLIPNVTLKDGVARLTEVEVAGVNYKNPKAISQALGISEAMYAYDLEKL